MREGGRERASERAREGVHGTPRDARGFEGLVTCFRNVTEGLVTCCRNVAGVELRGALTHSLTG